MPRRIEQIRAFARDDSIRAAAHTQVGKDGFEARRIAADAVHGGPALHEFA